MGTVDSPPMGSYYIKIMVSHTVFERFCWLQKRFHPPACPIASSSGTNRIVILGRRCSVCLPRCVLWPNVARLAYSVPRSRIGMWERHFDWYHFRPLRSTLTSKTRGRIGAGELNLPLKFQPDGGRMSKTLY